MDSFCRADVTATGSKKMLHIYIQKKLIVPRRSSFSPFRTEGVPMTGSRVDADNVTFELSGDEFCPEIQHIICISVLCSRGKVFVGEGLQGWLL